MLLANAKKPFSQCQTELKISPETGFHIIQTSRCLRVQRREDLKT